jgi:membrane-associated phospholipid phosphatase
MYNERHWLNDVLAGAGIGILSAKAAYWLLPWERRHLGKVSFLPFFAPDAEGDTAAGLTLAYSF